MINTRSQLSLGYLVGVVTFVPPTFVPLDKCPPDICPPGQVSPQDNCPPRTFVPLDKCPPRQVSPQGKCPPRHLSPLTIIHRGTNVWGDKCPLPTYKPSMDRKKFGQVLLLSTLPTYPKSLEIFELEFVLKRVFSYFCNKDTIG